MESIRLEEARMVNKLDDEYIKRRLFHLELKSKLNERKLKKLLSSDDYSEAELRREAELNEFLRAQLDYYRRKLDTSRRKLTSLEHEHIQLASDYQMLANKPKIAAEQQDQRIQNAYNEAQREYEVNRAKLTYLDSSLLNLEENLSQKRDLAARLTGELDSLGAREQLKKANLWKTSETTTSSRSTSSSGTGTGSSSSSSETESSSESISNMLSEASGRHKSPPSTPGKQSSEERMKTPPQTPRRLVKSARLPQTRRIVDNLEDIYFF